MQLSVRICVLDTMKQAGLRAPFFMYEAGGTMRPLFVGVRTRKRGASECGRLGRIHWVAPSGGTILFAPHRWDSLITYIRSFNKYPPLPEAIPHTKFNKKRGFFGD